MKIKCKLYIFLALCVFFGLILIAKTVDINWKSSVSMPSFGIKNEPKVDTDFKKLMVSLPHSEGKRNGIKIFDANNWTVYRSYPSGHLDIFYEKSAGKFERLNISAGWRRDSYPVLLMSVPGHLFFVSYDVVRNVPSGRSLSTSQPGFDVYELTPDTKGEPRVLKTGLNLGGGIDSIVYGRVFNETITLCAENQCANIDFKGGSKQWSINELEGYEFLEVAFGVNSAYALVRKRWDDRLDGELTADHADFFLAVLSPKGASLKPVSDNGIPYSLTVEGDNPSWLVAQSSKDMGDLLYHELLRMPNRGLISFGDNNLEGRVAWNQVYYLHGLITLLEGKLAVSSPDLMNYARERVRAEIELIARLSESDYPGYRVKRYSLDREPLLFALHLGRIADLLGRADRVGLGSEAVTNALIKIKKELLSFEHTVEKPVACKLPSGEKCRTLEYRQGYPFWADGLNVPFNYISGYVSGLLAVTSDAVYTDYAIELMKPLQEIEEFSQHPKVWRYWAFSGQDGVNYSRGYSLNTVDWVGNHIGLDVAHITYRSMDAAALLKLIQRQPIEDKYLLVNHFKKLVTDGMLLPSVNEELYFSEVVPLKPVVARRHSRSNQAWQIQSQVWALSDLSRQGK